MKRIVWIASFPKSGNTWLRFLFANYFDNSTRDGIDINELGLGRIASARWLFDEWSVQESSDLTDDEAGLIWPDVYRAIANSARGLVFLKIHQEWARNSAGLPLYPEDATAAVVYAVRNPLDVAVSMAPHMNISFNEAVTRMCDDTFTVGLYGDRIGVRFRERIGSWTTHARSWLDHSGLPVVVVRYEDLRSDTAGVFAKVIQALGAPPDADRIERAVRFSAFERMQQQERAKGFIEQTSKTELFFRGGRIGDGLRRLSVEDRRRLVAQHGAMMGRLGYSLPDERLTSEGCYEQ